MKYKFIYFDVAGTLLYKRQFIKNVQTVLKDFKIPLSAEMIRERHKIISETIKFPEKTSREFYQFFNREFLLSIGVVPNNKIVEAIFKRCKLLPWEKFNDLKALKKINLPMGIISNWDQTLIDKVTGLGFKFEPIIGSGTSGLRKPDRRIYTLAVKDAKCKPEETIYVGDSLKLDIIPALEVGFRAVLIDRFNDFPGFTGDKINSLEQLIKYLKQCY